MWCCHLHMDCHWYIIGMNALLELFIAWWMACLKPLSKIWIHVIGPWLCLTSDCGSNASMGKMSLVYVMLPSTNDLSLVHHWDWYLLIHPSSLMQLCSDALLDLFIVNRAWVHVIGPWLYVISLLFPQTIWILLASNARILMKNKKAGTGISFNVLNLRF